MSDNDTTPADADPGEADPGDAPDPATDAVALVPRRHGAAVTVGPDGQEVLHPSCDELLDVVAALRAEGFWQCLDVFAVDYLTHSGRSLPPGVSPERFEVVVLLHDHTAGERVRVRVQVAGPDPVCPSLFAIHPGSEAPEREAYDLFGIRFEGHPDMTRILMPDDWDGHPLRKDYAIGRIPVQFKGAPS